MLPAIDNVDLEGLDSKTLMELVYKVQNKERKRIANDLHDSIGCLLSTTSLLFDTVEPCNKERFEEAKLLLKEAQTELRRIVNNLLPKTLEVLGLEKAISQLCEQLSVKKGLLISYEFKGFEENKMDKEFEINVYRIVQEVLNNEIKYSNASKVELLLRLNKDILYIALSDNGKGVPQKAINNLSINSRIVSLGGRMEIESNSGGAMIRVYLPNVKNNN
jgi:signal transduction histidine kinase